MLPVPAPIGRVVDLEGGKAQPAGQFASSGWEGVLEFMHEGYCVKCKAKKPIADAVEEVMKNGRKAVKGRCPQCGAVMFKILGGKALLASSVSADPASPPATAPDVPSVPPTS
jgi:hypothetical protein